MGIAGGGPGSCADVDAAVDVCCGGGDGEYSREQMGMPGGQGGKFGSSGISSAAATSSSADVSASASSLGCTITTTLAGPVPTAMVDFFLMTCTVVGYALRGAAVPACVLGPSYDFMTCREPLLTSGGVSIFCDTLCRRI